MSSVYLSLGSNIDRQQCIEAGLEGLLAFANIKAISSVYESEAVGFDGDCFYNLVVAIETALSVAELSQQLKVLEDSNGRQRGGAKFSSRTLDVDILTYDHLSGAVDGVVLPRDEVSKNAFVLRPLAEIASSEVHPFYGVSYGELWQRYPQHSQALWPVSFMWRGQQLSKGISNSDD